ncbi:lanthionine synthetase C-like protein [Necator americanus]|uniref:Lanthionine synthetase C-like protein n=1 Tax=Necator americanus TaxID=51031 RepID=W2T8J7_NECAM|nr:lanthionine synthetase C-like protein [Necator americanus]ETN77521.1 lanthionine synthetase C-like protein [Necator americanus]
MGRYIKNPYVGKEATASQEVTEEWLERAVKTVADQIINRQIDDEEMQDVGPYTGLSGVAFALNKASPIVGSTARSTAEECWRYCERGSSSRQARFLCGDLGLYVTQMGEPDQRQALVSKIEKLADVLAKIFCKSAEKQSPKKLLKGQQRKIISLLPFEEFLRTLKFQEDYPSDEILVGRAGFLSGVLWIRKTIGPSLISNSCIQKVLSAMTLSGRRYSLQRKSPCPLMYEYHGTEYLGAAHGLAGILQMALGFYDLLSDSEERAVHESADWLISTQDDEGNFASSVKWIGRERGDDQLVHWCHGAPGVILLCLTMWKRYGDQKYFKAALHAGELIWNKGVLKKGPGICHGVGGNGYALLMLYRASGDEEWLQRARCFALMLLDRNIRALQRTPDSPFSLFEGLSGALCFLVDLMPENIDKAQFPLYPVPF